MPATKTANRQPSPLQRALLEGAATSSTQTQFVPTLIAVGRAMENGGIPAAIRFTRNASGVINGVEVAHADH